MPERLKNRYWRLNNLYWIVDENNQRVKFQFTWSQQIMYKFMWYFNIILKARQVRSTTFWCIFILDMCLFNSNIRAGIIAHNREEAEEIFEHKIKYPYNQLPEELKSELSSDQASARKISFTNNSSIRVGTSLRSGTYAVVLITEHGKICAKYPEKAKEITSGTIPTIHPGQMFIDESTAEGSDGDFYRFCTTARNNKIEGRELSKLDFKFFFFPWWKQPEYQISPAGVDIPPKLIEYFNSIEGLPIPTELEEYYGKGFIRLNDAQKAWYVKRSEIMGFLMKQEYPSTPEEAFESSAMGLPFSPLHHVIRPVQIPDNAPVYTTFDWGYGKPFSWLWFWIDADGRFYMFAEWYGWSGDPDVGLRLTDTEIAIQMLEFEGKMDFDQRNVKVRLSGHDCWNKKPDYKGGGQGPSTAEVFASHGIYLTKADSNRSLKIRQLRERLMIPDDKEDRPMLQVYDTCKQFIRTIQTLRADDNHPEDIDTTGEDHCYDSTCQLCMFRPMALKDPKPLMTMAAHRIDYLEKGTAEDQFYKQMAMEQVSADLELRRILEDRFGENVVQVADFVTIDTIDE